MKTSELNNIRSEYELFNVILFNNSLPRANKIDFILHDFVFAAGYSRHRDDESETGNTHEIAFCKFFEFSERQIREILIHEMIHLWQDTHVAEWRYKRCTNDIAHDKVFTSKMNTINLLLARKGYDLTIKQVCDDKLHLDKDIVPDEDKHIIFIEDFGGHHVFLKAAKDSYDNIVKNIIEKNTDKNKIFKNVFSIKSRSYIYNLLEEETEMPESLSPALDPDTEEDLFLQNINNPDEWIIKDEEVVYDNNENA